MSILRAGGALVRANGAVSRMAGRSVLTPSDFTYLGVHKFPLDAITSTNVGVRFSYSRGMCISGRRVGGNLHLFMGSATGGGWQQPLVEMVVDSAPAATIAAASRLSVYKAWGLIYGTDAGGTPNQNTVEGSGASLNGLHWDGEKLLWSQGANYSSENHRTIGAVTFNGTTSMNHFGAWRTTHAAKKTNGFLCGIPASQQANFGGSTVCIGGLSTSLNESGVWGHSLRHFNSAGLLSLPYDAFGNTAAQSIPATVVMDADFTTRMARSATYKNCTLGFGGSPPAGSTPYNCADGNTLSALQATASEIDTAHGAQWIETTTKHGIVFISALVDRDANAAYRTTNYGTDDYPHYWYSGEDTNCCHGQLWATANPYKPGAPLRIPGTGPHTPSYTPQMWIYDPEVLTNGQTVYQRANAPSTSHKHLRDWAGANMRQNSDYYEYGAYFDSTSRRLYVPEMGEMDTDQFEALGVIHVWEVAN